MDTLSVWRGTAAPTDLPPLSGDASCEVLIVGGGITGLTLALLLARQGRQVVLLEADRIGSGSTGNSTGNLYVTTSRGLHGVLSRWGADVACEVVAERRAAIEFIERQAAAADFGFRRCPLVLYAQSAGHQSAVDQEREALARAGCATQSRSDVPAGFPPPPVTCWCCRTRHSSSRRRTRCIWPGKRRTRAQASTSCRACSRSTPSPARCPPQRAPFARRNW